VLCARGLLVDAMAVLLDCAVKFSADGEIVGITSRREGGSVSVRISATGPGIPEGVQGRFFDILAVREPLTPGGDLGLGPPVAAELIRLLGGRATVESGARGVCFVVTLRAAEPAATDGR
jgi:K+-sensing histidine kinase KdpD